MPDLHLDQPFFARPATKRIVDEIGHALSLCVFAGAGVSVDRTGMTWEGLIAHLFSELEERLSYEDSRKVVQALGVLEAGSAVIHRHYEHEGKDNWQQHVSDLLRGQLYKNRDALGGQASLGIAQLWREFRESHRELSIATTNYDEHIWLDISDSVAAWRRDGADLDISRDPVIYLHGKIPRVGEVPRVGKRVQYPVVSELDFVNQAQRTQDRLKKEFEGKNVLIVGSSLKDRPLVDALIRSKDVAESAGLRRWAFIPRTDLDAFADSPMAKTILENHHARLSHLGVEGVYFDFYSQVAQLLTEVIVAGKLPVGSYGESPQDHDRRLNRWWEDWYGGCSTENASRELQNKHHDDLVRAVAGLKSALHAEEEEIKAELWLRWQPSANNRELRLWASSFSRFSRWPASRTASIASHGHMMCVKAFHSGQIEYTGDSQVESSDRWKALVAFPISANVRGQVKMTVGVMVLASMTPDVSRLGRQCRGTHEIELIRLRELAQELASPPSA